MGKSPGELRKEERDFFRNTRDAIFSNPFGERRASIDRLILANTTDNGRDKEKQLATKVAVRLDRLLSEQGKNIYDYRAKDSDLLRYGVLFSVFHRFCDRLDELIITQLEQGDAPSRVNFSEECLGLLAGYGLNSDDAEKCFALFFQLRRAFFFINRIIGSSIPMQGLRLNLWNNVFTHDLGLYEDHLWNRMEDFSTILQGETGTGKGMAAAAIGRSGFIPFDRAKGCFVESFTRAFVSINFSQYPEELLESELFGHKKGAFTGAIENHDGVFGRCSPHGSIFLDEIGEIAEPVQIKLLTVLQERRFCPVGSHHEHRFHGRVIAATNQDLLALRKKGRFRNDFYYRLCSDSIQVPTLRSRIHENEDELGQLLERTVTHILGTDSSEIAGFIEEAIRRNIPQDYPWPGNVRELEQCARRILIKHGYEGDQIVAAGGRQEEDIGDQILRGTLTASELLTVYCRHLYDRLGSYEAVARQVDLDRRTVKKHITEVR
ncbi:MAG: sigma 54-interacting transcriptional regulator [Thermodesulfobacteriota bacterium]